MGEGGVGAWLLIREGLGRLWEGAQEVPPPVGGWFDCCHLLRSRPLCWSLCSTWAWGDDGPQVAWGVHCKKIDAIELCSTVSIPIMKNSCYLPLECRKISRADLAYTLHTFFEFFKMQKKKKRNVYP